jgi:hypothetical protein
MKNLLLLAVIGWLTTVPAYADSGLVNIPSAHSVARTANRMETMFKEKGLRIFIAATTRPAPKMPESSFGRRN